VSAAARIALNGAGAGFGSIVGARNVAPPFAAASPARAISVASASMYRFFRSASNSPRLKLQ
jgi:hypothetical protein